jgi:asparagine synthase (glutamine-hydrolysing)
MPGIVGFITSLPSEKAIAEVRRMTESLLHEDFYTAGTWEDPSRGVYIGWVARKGSFCDGMPLFNERKNVVLVFSGEEYPEPGIAQRLRARGHGVENDTPSSYLVHVCEEDPFFPAGLNGRFNGLLVDKTRERVVLFNDRYGMHRVYYYEAKEGFYFASEAKAILNLRPELRRLNLQSFGEFVSCGAVLGNRTLFEGLHVLPQGAAWEFRGRKLERKAFYFTPKEWEEQETLEPETYYRDLREKFAEILPRYFVDGESIAMSLTGGLDTRMILANYQSRPGSLPCYTFGSMYREHEDVRVARRVADACHQPFQVLTSGAEFLAQFGRYAERTVEITEGCVDVSRAPDLYLNELARRVAPVRMTGIYGGEILRKVVGFKAVDPADGVFSDGALRLIREGAQTYTAIRECHPVSFAAFRQGPWYMHGNLALEETQVTMRTPYLDNDFVRAVFRSPASALNNAEVSLRLVEDGNKTLSAIPTDRGLAGSKRTLPVAVAHGMQEVLFKAEYTYDLGMPQWLAKVDHALSIFHLERLFLGRHKPFHFRSWYRYALADYLRDVLLDSSSLGRSWVNREGMEKVVSAHLKGIGNYTHEIHKLLTLELLHRRFFSPFEAERTPSSAANAVSA